MTDSQAERIESLLGEILAELRRWSAPLPAQPGPSASAVVAAINNMAEAWPGAAHAPKQHHSIQDRIEESRRDDTSATVSVAAYASLGQLAILLGVSRRRIGDLRNDPTFPAGRTFGGAGLLRFHIASVLKWAEARPPAKWSSIGAAKRLQKRKGGK